METQTIRKPKSRSALRQILSRRSSRAGVIIIGALLIFLLLGPILSPYAPQYTSGLPNSPPSLQHLFGTDNSGRDLLSQFSYGAYPSLIIALESALGAAILGFVIGVGGAYFRRVEQLVSGATDVILTFPLLVIALVILSFYVPTNTNIAITLMVFLWPPVARAVRNQVTSLKKLAYIGTAKLSGISDLNIAYRIIGPQVAPVAIAYFIIDVSVAVIIVTSLEFLGVGNPTDVTWGSILYWADQFAFQYGDWWWIAEPGVLISMLAFGLALIGFSVEEIMNPRLHIK